MNPNQVAFIETLHHHFGKQAIYCIVGRPELGLSSTVTVNRALPDIVHRVIRKAVCHIICFCDLVKFLSTSIWSRFVDRGDIVQHWPQYALTKSIVPAKYIF
jgi:hypothetical protein